MKVYAYIRVSTQEQTTDNQRKLIADGGFHVDEVFSEDGVSGSVNALERPVFAEMAGKLQDGDTLIVTALDRLGRSASDILQVVEMFKVKGVKVRVMQFDGIVLTSPVGKMIMTCMAAMAELERNLLIERTKAGMERTRAQGTRFGRPLTIEPDVLERLVEKRKQGWTLVALADAFGIPKNSIDRNVKQWGEDLEGYRSEWAAREAQYKNKEVA